MEKLNKEQRKFVREVLSFPSKEMIEKALEYVNLTSQQKEVIDILEFQNKTEMEACDILPYDIRTIQREKKVAFEKMFDVWSKNYLVSMMIKRA